MDANNERRLISQNVNGVRAIYQKRIMNWLDTASPNILCLQETRARERNVGWRIDYFFVAHEYMHKITDAIIFTDVMGSDHYPVGIKLST